METLKIGVAGLGRLGLIHAENIYNMKGIELTAISNLDEKINKKVKEKYKVPYTYTSYEDMLENPELDAVCIVTPSGFHTEHIRLALAKNLHIFCEKPIGLDVEDIKNTIKVIEKHDRIFHLGFMRRYDEDYLYAKELIDNGGIGDISLIRSYSIDPIQELDSFVNFAKKSPSGGLFLDMSVHDIDVIRWLTNSEISTVWATGNNKAAPELSEVNELDMGTVTMKLENNVTALLVAGRTASHGYHVETEIIGTKGMIRVAAAPEKNKVTVFNEHGTVRPSSQHFPERFARAYENEIKDFVRCIRENKSPEVTSLDGLRGTEVALACQKSFNENKLVDVKY
ncbi:MAG: Gfo/Idh/MocA family oxidoreductase [Bacillota bacterium]|uniref:Gfo/Idh/MocA family oxidoreductase n=1 Tax=Virgibacillus salarius TaxID=447199 RepID=A0A941DVG7_9BACI|nr:MULTISPECIES: Gfo/Idh/MocA family oxidoreductase [Bacillaceae]MBR7796092.1 Gfo/Idh/MocA family oxidoreductase [Virgibacillus salarius]MCC2250418.1 Gfo/Idh/MocA family oxidoreductase [Virgibacillus sp. AGTR]NAZ08801.1 Gfo/Idh/MocA family oxidoreductase [Agaribacter marinus]WBX81544.1 Gfo/Idh/MocA family oxidoreductase [Virgibacillus salarius]